MAGKPIMRGGVALSDSQIVEAVSAGGRLVMFQWTVSVLVLSFRRTSDIHLFQPGESRTGKALPWVLLTLLVGWWGIPWGPIWTVQSIYRNLSGGIDVTDQLVGPR